MKMSAANHAEVYRDYTIIRQWQLDGCCRDGCTAVSAMDIGLCAWRRMARLTVIASEYQGKQLNSPNDVVVRSAMATYIFPIPIHEAVLDPKRTWIQRSLSRDARKARFR